MRHGWLQGKNWGESMCMVCAEETVRNWLTGLLQEKARKHQDGKK